ncbi:MAG: AraC family transcriptional regulator [Pelosinus sp.]|nr:AraC family transcriptional regulator [Pelosinus sp.]
MSESYKPLKSKRGYLNSNFEFFNLQDNQVLQIQSHYHDFDKIIIFISGKVTYLIEGKAYKLQPLDILLVNQSAIHQPIIDASVPYKRIVLWLKPAFLQQYQAVDSDLSTCFALANKYKFNLLRFSPEMQQRMQEVLAEIHESKQGEFGSQVLREALVLKLLVYVNRTFLARQDQAVLADIEYDATICKLLQYINEHLAEDLSVEKLASLFFLSKYYLMRKFKYHTGYTLHNYILHKRLIAANNLIRSGQSTIAASMSSGFGDYSTFVRAFKKVYRMSPKQYHTTSF